MLNKILKTIVQQSRIPSSAPCWSATATCSPGWTQTCDLPDWGSTVLVSQALPSGLDHFSKRQHLCFKDSCHGLASWELALLHGSLWGQLSYLFFKDQHLILGTYKSECLLEWMEKYSFSPASSNYMKKKSTIVRNKRCRWPQPHSPS